MRFESIPSAWRGHERFADWLVRAMQPITIVDLGVDYGFSTIAFARPNIGTVYAIDWFKGDLCTGARNTFEEYKKNIEEAGVTNVKTIVGEFSEVVQGFPDIIDILHIDGAHDYLTVKRDFEQWNGLVRQGGVILMHDIRVFPNDAGRAYKEIIERRDEGWTGFEFEHASGLGVLVKPF